MNRAQSGSSTPIVRALFLLSTQSSLNALHFRTDRYKMAGQWYGLVKLFHESKNEGYEIIKNEGTLIQCVLLPANDG